ncbi:unnamed protein product, partial [Polarella glacialis]
EFGLVGNATDYYRVENSLLHAVLQSRRGIPISLCIVWAAVARRCGLACHLLAGFPQHVLIRVPVQQEAEAMGHAESADLYDSGQLMDWSDVLQFAARLLGPMLADPERLDEAVRGFVQILPPVNVYMRLLRNLLNIYQKHQDHACMLGVVSQMRSLGDASDGLERLERALALELGREPPQLESVDEMESEQ